MSILEKKFTLYNPSGFSYTIGDDGDGSGGMEIKYFEDGSPKVQAYVGFSKADGLLIAKALLELCGDK